MKVPSGLYKDALGTLTDFYQLSMAQSYWTSGTHNKHAVFHLFFRKNPFGGNFAIAAGLEYVINWLNNFHFTVEDIEYLQDFNNPDGSPLFEEDFLNYLWELELTCDVNAIPEGTIVFPQEPLLQITGPILQCQLVETALLNMLNYQTLIATKAARVVSAAEGNKVSEFGLRRAQGIDGGLAGSRAAYIGGCHSTSNVLAGKLFDIPVNGTHAHSWVMSFASELEAFRTYAKAMPHNCTFLVDTYDVIQGIKNVITVAKEQKAKGYTINGIRLDSGDLCALSIQARQMLNDAGFPEIRIMASNDLDEYEIKSLKSKGCKIDGWGVGTNLITAADQPALGGVYKIGAIEEEGKMIHKIKKSADLHKSTNPGILRVMRFTDKNGKLIGDVLSDDLTRPNPFKSMVQFVDGVEQPVPHEAVKFLLQPIFQKGKLVYSDTLPEIRKRAEENLKSINVDKIYPVGLEKELFAKKQEMLK